MSDKLVMDAGMPQGSYLGPLTFITLVDSLQASYMTHKYVDDINGRKTEMLIGPISKDPPSHLMLCGATVDRVTTFKLPGVHVSSNLKWTDNVNAMVSSAASRLHFLKQLNRAGSQPFHSIKTHTNSTNLSCPTVWTTSHSHCNLFKESCHLTIIIKLS